MYNYIAIDLNKLTEEQKVALEALNINQDCLYRASIKQESEAYIEYTLNINEHIETMVQAKNISYEYLIEKIEDYMEDYIGWNTIDNFYEDINWLDSILVDIIKNYK